MTRKGNSRPVDSAEWRARHKLGREYLQSAESLMMLMGDADAGNPAMSVMISAAIAYTDAVTGFRLGRVNQKDHASAPALLAEAVGNRLSPGVKNKLIALLREKDAVQYTAHIARKPEAEAMMARLQTFVDWAEAELGA